MDYKDLVKGLEEIVKTHYYKVIGKLKETPVLITTLEGTINLSVLKGGKLENLAKSVIDVASPKPQLDYVPFTRDVEKGKEVHSVYTVNLKGEESEVSSPRKRVTSIAYDEKTIVYTASSAESTSLGFSINIIHQRRNEV
ncbi:hypothetical protein [Stygiolobus caldivivus]|uniref:Acylamino-acid-releasing enzyme-like N-terminal domain-containing protein n=1 Tax=Stygiolobus caldivivus TaxID=2824673 RepID=A0A8D5ZEU7_9CREN|nr:hypothetical protein [Stygiolobus caldivivus]BCU69883.1 hypothetical protein KN1_11800 [Stygiolobus caldivivus]